MKKGIIYWIDLFLLAAAIEVVLLSINLTPDDWQFWALWACVLLGRHLPKYEISAEKNDEPMGCASWIVFAIWGLEAILILLKLFNIISWSWVWICSPLWLTIIVAWIIYVITGIIIKKTEQR